MAISCSSRWRAEAAGLLGDLRRRLQGLLDPVVALAPYLSGLVVLGPDLLLRPDLRRLRCLPRAAHLARLPVAGLFKPPTPAPL